MGDGVECTHGQGVYLFEYVDSWGVKDPLCMTRATRMGEDKESKNKEIEFHVLNIQGDFFNWASPEFAKCWPVSD